MSDTNFQLIYRKSKKIDLIDEEWENDCLSDDEIILSKDVDFRDIEEDDDNADNDEKVGNDEINDLGLAQLHDSLEGMPSQTETTDIPSSNNSFPS